MIGCLKSITDRKRSSPVDERQLRLQYLGNMMTNIIALQALALTHTIKAAVLWCLKTQVGGASAVSSLDKSKTMTGQNVAGVGACRQLPTPNQGKCKTTPRVSVDWGVDWGPLSESRGSRTGNQKSSCLFKFDLL
jgi:hypothetical protein